MLEKRGMASSSSTRTSSPHSKRSPPTRRPKLMRASATEPSLATSNASRKDLALAGLQNSRAATLLTRVASYSSAQMGMAYGGGGRGNEKRQSVGSVGSLGSFCESPVDERRMERKEPFEIVISQCGNYYSFPSFEYFEDYQESQETIDGRQEQDVP